MTKRHLGLAAVMLWEAYWAYLFFSAPRPDERMETVFALLMGVVLPAVFVLPVAAARLGRRLGRGKFGEKPE